MSVIIYNPEALVGYIDGMRNQCYALQQSQIAMETRFLRLEETWSDHVYTMTADQLTTLSKSILQLYGELGEYVVHAAMHANRLNETQGYHIARANESRVDGFNSKILQRGKTMTTSNKTNIVNLEAMFDFEKALGVYIEDTQRTLEKIKREHHIIGETRVWNAPQHRQFGDVLDDISGKMNASLQNLTLVRMIISKKRQELEIEYSKHL